MRMLLSCPPGHAGLVEHAEGTQYFSHSLSRSLYSSRAGASSMPVMQQRTCIHGKRVTSMIKLIGTRLHACRPGGV